MLVLSVLVFSLVKKSQLSHAFFPLYTHTSQSATLTDPAVCFSVNGFLAEVCVCVGSLPVGSGLLEFRNAHTRTQGIYYFAFLKKKQKNLTFNFPVA